MGTAPSCLVSGPRVIRQGIVVQSESSIKEVAGMEPGLVAYERLHTHTGAIRYL